MAVDAEHGSDGLVKDASNHLKQRSTGMAFLAAKLASGAVTIGIVLLGAATIAAIVSVPTAMSTVPVATTAVVEASTTAMGSHIR